MVADDGSQDENFGACDLELVVCCNSFIREGYYKIS